MLNFDFFCFTIATPFHVARLIQAVVDSVPANADVHVEINQNPTGFENTQIEVQRVPLQHSASATNTSSNNTTSSEPGFFNNKKKTNNNNVYLSVRFNILVLQLINL